MTNHSQWGRLSWAQIVESSVKLINFYDMGGSESSLKTTVKVTFKIKCKALNTNYLDYLFLVISADKGITKTTSGFLKIALSMNLPLVAVITKIDLISQDDLFDLVTNFKLILKAEKKGKNPLVAKNNDDIVTFSRNISEGILPIFLVNIF